MQPLPESGPRQEPGEDHARPAAPPLRSRAYLTQRLAAWSSEDIVDGVGRAILDKWREAYEAPSIRPQPIEDAFESSVICVGVHRHAVVAPLGVIVHGLSLPCSCRNAVTVVWKHNATNTTPRLKPTR